MAATNYQGRALPTAGGFASGSCGGEPASGKQGPPRPVGSYLTPAEAAALIGVSRASICRWVATGRLRGYKVAGNRVLVAPEDLHGVIAAVVPEPGG